MNCVVETDEDRFLGEESSWMQPAVTRKVGDEIVAKYKACPDSGEKRCNQEFER